MKDMGKLVSTLLLALIVSGQASAQAPEDNPIVVEQPWARATPAGAKTGAAYVTLINNGPSADRLVGATTSLAEKVQFHKEVGEGGVSRMRELRAIDVEPKAKVTFKPGDMHIMLVGLKEPLKEGQTFPLTLDFERAGKVDLTVSIARIGAMQPAGTPHGAHH